MGTDGPKLALDSSNILLDRSDDSRDDNPSIPDPKDPIGELIVPGVNETDRIIGGGRAPVGSYTFAARIYERNVGL